MVNVAFFGTSDRSTPILEALKGDSNVNLALCITKSDTKVGRNQTVRETEVKKWAQKNGIDFVTSESIKKDSQKIIEQLQYSKVDLGLVADFSFIIPEEILNAPKYGIINIHFSLLPKWRGAAPVQFAILNGDESTGITYQLTAKAMDRGNVIYQIGYKTADNETSDELYEKLFHIAADNLPKVIAGYLDKTLLLKEQDETNATYTYSPSHPGRTFIFKEDAKIDWAKSPVEIERAVRAYKPWPIAWTTLGELLLTTTGKSTEREDAKKRVKIFEAEIK
jgi:methionyl-tRNA formyltransferase